MCAFKVDVPKQPDVKTYYKFHNTENKASEYLVFLDNCMPVNDDHKQHDHSSHHSSHDHSSYDHSSSHCD